MYLYNSHTAYHVATFKKEGDIAFAVKIHNDSKEIPSNTVFYFFVKNEKAQVLNSKGWDISGMERRANLWIQHEIMRGYKV